MVDFRSCARVFPAALSRLLRRASSPVLTQQPWLFPSLGPMVIFHVGKPTASQSLPQCHATDTMQFHSHQYPRNRICLGSAGALLWAFGDSPHGGEMAGVLMRT